MNAINTDTLAAERQAFADLAVDFAAKKLAEKREENDRYPFGELFHEAIRDAGIVGFYGVNLPSDYGGVEMNTGMVAIILEKLSAVDASMAAILFTNAAAIQIIQESARDASPAKLYESIADLGTIPLAFLSYTSPDEHDLPVIAQDGTISGSIPYLALGGMAKHAVIPARAGGEGYSYYCIDLGNAGVSLTKPIVSLGMHACPAVDATLDRVPGTLIGRAGAGADYFRSTRDRMALCAAAISAGILKGSFEEAIVYAGDRFQGGRQIIDWGQVRMMLANMAIELKIARTLLTGACREMDESLHGWELTAGATAIHICEMAVRATTDGVQLLGGNGYMKDYGQEKRMRDAKQAQCLLGMALLRKMDHIGQIIAARK